MHPVLLYVCTNNLFIEMFICRNTWSFEGMSSAIKPSLKLMGDRVIAEYKEGNSNARVSEQ